VNFASESARSHDGPDPVGGGLTLAFFSLLVLFFGMILTLNGTGQVSLSRELLANGNQATATAVRTEVVFEQSQMDITAAQAGTYKLRAVHVTFSVAGHEVRTDLRYLHDSAKGLPKGDQPAPAGSRYAPPLDIVYSSTDPSIALARGDAEDWAAHPHRVWFGYALLGAGALGLLAGLIIFGLGLRRA
jgi:hypothetical protein